MQKSIIIIILFIALCLISLIGFAEQNPAFVNYAGSVNNYNESTVIVSGKVNIQKQNIDSAIILGGGVNLSGMILKNLIAMAGSLSLAGEIGADSILIGGYVHTKDQAQFKKNVLIISGKAKLEGNFNKDIIIIAGDAIIAGNIDGDVTTFAGHVTILPTAHIKGDLTYGKDTQLQIDNGATIDGSIAIWAKKATPKQEKSLHFSWFWPRLIFQIGLFLIGLLLIVLLHKYNARVYTKFSKRTLASLGMGFAALIIVPVVILLLMFTIIGIPLAIVLLLGYFLALIFAYIYMALNLGLLISGLFSKDSAKYSKWCMILALVIGLVLLALLRLIPYLGWWIAFFALVLGLGSMLLAMLRLDLKVDNT